MRVLRAHVSGRSGRNGAPSTGSVWFDDGRSYGFHTVWAQADDGTWSRNDGYGFSGTRLRAHGGHEGFTFRSPARDAALQRFLDGEV